MRDLEGGTLLLRSNPGSGFGLKRRAESLRWVCLKTARHAHVKTDICAAARLLGKCYAVSLKRVTTRGTAAASVIWFSSMGRALEFKMV